MKRVFLRGDAEKLRNYTAALASVGVESAVSMDLSLAEHCDGLLLPGGADVDPVHFGQKNTASRGIDPDRDRDEFALIELFLKLERPILGICRGHQILNVALGGTLIQDLPDESHHQREDGVDRVHLVTVLHPFLSSLYGERLVTNTAHHQAVDRLGKGLHVTCVGDDGVVEGFVHENGRIIGVQFHPERMAFEKRRTDADDGAAIFRTFAKML